MAGKFTDRSVAALRPRQERYEVFDGTGFGVRVSPRGIKSFIYVYRFQGRTRRLTIGTYGTASPHMSLAAAQVELARARKAIEEGLDPATTAVDAKKAERRAETFSELVEEYIERYARPRKRSAAEDERILQKDVLPAWGRRKAKDISRRDVVSLLDGIVDRNAPIQANRTLAVVRRVFNWAISRDLLQSSPCIQVRAPARENRRDRVLSEGEIRNFWLALTSSALAMTDLIRIALKFQLATIQRVGEVAGMRWSEVDFNTATWTIGAERSKNRLPHRVPLSDLALDLLEHARAAALRRDEIAERPALLPGPWVFPSPVGTASIAPLSIARALRVNLESIGLRDVTPHDLRRTGASHMTSAGIPRLVVARLLNHAETGVTATYDRHSYDGEKRAALLQWSRRLSAIVGDDARASVVAIHGAR